MICTIQKNPQTLTNRYGSAPKEPQASVGPGGHDAGWAQSGLSQTLEKYDAARKILYIKVWQGNLKVRKQPPIGIPRPPPPPKKKTDTFWQFKLGNSTPP